MKKVSLILLGLLVIAFLAGCATSEAPAQVVESTEVAAEEVKSEAANVCPFAGEYYVLFTSEDTTEPNVGESFVVGEDCTVNGAMEGSGLTGFTGTVAADGSFTAEFTRLGGTMTGVITADGKLTAHSEVRGRVSEITGERL